MDIAENVKWVIIEVEEVDGAPKLFVAPNTLKIQPGFVGNIVWYVFTEGWELAEDGIVPVDNGFPGNPQPDPDRPGCWNTATSDIATAATGNLFFHYTINVHNKNDGARVSSDPVVENEAPPGGGLSLSVRRRAPVTPNSVPIARA